MSPLASFVQETLDTYFPDPQIPLVHRDPYTLLIAVLLSAQSTDARVNEISPILFARASTPQQMIKIPLDVIEEIIRPIGLAPTKAKAILGLSQILVDKYEGKVPATFEDLESLPGVGHKTASVVMAQAFHIPAFPVDTHIHRCAMRWGLSNGKSVEKTEADLKNHFPRELWNKLHLQMILFARTFCPAKAHDPMRCPICKNLPI